MSWENCYKFRFVIGDRSNDGHGMTQQYYINTNCSPEAIDKAYTESVEKTGISFSNTDDNTKLCIAVDYEDTGIPCVAYHALKPYGIDVYDYMTTVEWSKGTIDEDVSYLDEDEPIGYIDDVDDFFRLLMDFIAISLPDYFEYKNITDNTPQFKYSIGYGLFSN